MVRCCKAEGCTAGRRKGSQLAFFKTPKKPWLLAQWCQALGKQLKHNDLVCELHFKEEDVVKEHIHILPNGTRWTMKRDRKILVPNAVPYQDLELVPIKMEDEQTNDSSNKLTINDIKEHLELYALPPAWSWLYVDDKELTFICINKINYETKFHLKLQEDLSLMMYANETKIDLHFTVTSIENLYRKFDQLNELQVCAGTTIGPNEGRSQYCTGVVMGNALCNLEHAKLRCRSCQLNRDMKQKYKRNSYILGN